MKVVSLDHNFQRMESWKRVGDSGVVVAAVVVVLVVVVHYNCYDLT